MANQAKLLNGVPLTPDNFANPPLELGIVPFWFWNGDLEYDELEWQMRQYYDRGVRSLFIHGRMGLNVPYLSEGWFERVKFVVEKGSEIGLDTWVYDEMDWPSGTAQRQVLDADPDLGQRYLELVALHINGPLFTFLEAHDDRYVNTGNSNPIAAYGVTAEEYRDGIKQVIDLNKNLSWEKTIPWEAPEGRWVLMYFLEKRAPYYIDTLNPASTEKFIELTHEKYKRAVGAEFGSTVPGFFTDEPAMYYYHVGLNNYVVPWSKRMFKIFRDRRGYDLKPHLPALYTEMGEETPRIRYDFWRTLTEQYSETYYKRIRDWCDENGVIFTGHLLFEEWLRLSARCEGNLFKYLQHMHLIGVDHLYPKIGSKDEPAEHVALKVGSSAAHHFGSTRLLCESMGGTYWDCTLERMKWMNNWEYVLGVNLFNNHGYHYTIEGERKRDWPPSQFYHHTWWKYYDLFVKYNARLSHVLSGGRHVAKVLMLYPMSSMWTNYVPQQRTPVASVIEDDFNYLTDALLRLHYDFDYVDEDVLADAIIENGVIRIADEEYSTFVLPPVTHIKAATFERLKHFVESGGSLIADTLFPVGLLESGEGGDIQAVEDFFGLDPDEARDDFLNGRRSELEVVYPNPGSGVVALRGPGLAKLKPDAELRRILNDCDPPDVTVDREEVFYLHLEKSGFDLYFLINTTQEDLGRVAVSFERVGRPELWDANTGRMSPINVFRIQDDRLFLELDFPASESHIIVLREDPVDTHVLETNLDIETVESDKVIGFMSGQKAAAFAQVNTPDGVREVMTARLPDVPDVVLPGDWQFSIEQDNVLVVGRWKMSMEDDLDGTEPVQPEYDDSDWLEVTDGSWEMQLPHEREAEVYPVALWYRTQFEVGVVPDGMRLMVDGFSGEEHRLFVNGKELDDPGVRSWLDAEIREVEIGPHVLEGLNHVAVRLVARRRTDGMLDLLKLVGSFGLEGSNQGYRISERSARIGVGDWTKQGYPFFSGTGVYAADVDVPVAMVDGGRVYLEADCGEDVLEVSINGSEGRIAPWHPYRLDVSDLIVAGSNHVEIRVTNTLINILEGVEKASGLKSAPRLVHACRYELAF
jgi:hypothetical protein